MRVSINELSKGMSHLAGATNGEQHLGKLAKQLAGEDLTVFVDFTGIESATSSYLKALLFSFFDENQRAQAVPNLRGAFPVVIRLNDVLREELSQLATFAGRQIVEGVKARGDEVLVARLHGKLDPALEQTLTTLQRRGASTATDLHAESSGNIAITAWNNRLADLYARRLAKRRKLGKQWIYEPITREFEHG